MKLFRREYNQVRHSIYRVISFEFVEPFTLRVKFDDDTMQVIDFEPLLEGELYSPLRELNLFDQVTIDPDVHTLVQRCRLRPCHPA